MDDKTDLDIEWKRMSTNTNSKSAPVVRHEAEFYQWVSINRYPSAVPAVDGVSLR